jgi:hypothetical protein
MFRHVATILVAILLSASVVAGITPFPASFHTQMVPTNGTSLHIRVGGKGPAVVLLHGFGFTGDMWTPPSNCSSQGPYRQETPFLGALQSLAECPDPSWPHSEWHLYLLGFADLSTQARSEHGKR